MRLMELFYDFDASLCFLQASLEVLEVFVTYALEFSLWKFFHYPLRKCPA